MKYVVTVTRTATYEVDPKDAEIDGYTIYDREDALEYLRMMDPTPDSEETHEVEVEEVYDSEMPDRRECLCGCGMIRGCAAEEVL